MRRWAVMWLVGVTASVAVLIGSRDAHAQKASTQGVMLEDLTWIEAEKVLTPDTVVVIPVGAASKEHGPHLKLRNDYILAEYLKIGRAHV